MAESLDDITGPFDSLQSAVRAEMAETRARHALLARVALPTLTLLASQETATETDPFRLIGRLCRIEQVHVRELGSLVALDDVYRIVPNIANEQARELSQADPIELASGVRISRAELAEIVDTQVAIDIADEDLRTRIADLYHWSGH